MGPVDRVYDGFLDLLLDRKANVKRIDDICKHLAKLNPGQKDFGGMGSRYYEQPKSRNAIYSAILGKLKKFVASILSKRGMQKECCGPMKMVCIKQVETLWVSDDRIAVKYIMCNSIIFNVVSNHDGNLITILNQDSSTTFDYYGDREVAGYCYICINDIYEDESYFHLNKLCPCGKEIYHVQCVADGYSLTKCAFNKEDEHKKPAINSSQPLKNTYQMVKSLDGGIATLFWDIFYCVKGLYA